MNYSNNEMKFIALSHFQSRIFILLKIIINKQYYKSENKKKFFKNLLGNIQTISSEINDEHNNIIELQYKYNDLSFNLIINIIDNLLNCITQDSEFVIEKYLIAASHFESTQVNVALLNNFIKEDEILEFYQNKISEIYKELEKMNDSIDSNVTITIENSISPIWILPTSTFECTNIVQILNDGCEESLTVNEIFMNRLMVSSRIEETLNSWISKNNSKVKKRIFILKEAVTAHLEEKYYLSVSALIPQIEGLLKDAIDEANITGVNLESLKEGCIKNAADKLAIEWKKRTKTIQRNLVDLLSENFPKVIADLYKDYNSEDDQENKLNRHGICHGLQTNFGIATSSLRLILIIDRIIFFMADDENNK